MYYSLVWEKKKTKKKWKKEAKIIGFLSHNTYLSILKMYKTIKDCGSCMGQEAWDEKLVSGERKLDKIRHGITIIYKRRTLVLSYTTGQMIVPYIKILAGVVPAQSMNKIWFERYWTQKMWTNKKNVKQEEADVLLHDKTSHNYQCLDKQRER